MTSPRFVLRQSSLTQSLYMQRDGTWGPYATAKRYATQEAAAADDPDDRHGIFPCSAPRRIGRVS